MFKKLATAAVLSGALSMGTAGVAFGATTGPSGSGASGGGNASARHFTCAQAPQVMDRIQKVQARIATALPKLQAREDKALKAGKTRRAAAIAKRISRLDKVQERTTDVVARIERACPNAASVSPGSTGSGSTGSGSTGSGSTGSGGSTSSTTGVTTA